MATKNQQDQDHADFADQFNKDDVKPIEQSDDEAFGLGPEEDANAADGAAAATGAPADPPAAADAAGATAAPAGDDQAKALDERTAALDARERELDARAASIQTSNTNEDQTSTATDDAGGKGDGGGESAEDAKDPRAALEEDFGPEFVKLLIALITDVVSGSVTGKLGGLEATIQGVIDDLKNERHQSHFKAIAAAHGDFMDIVNGPEFAEWLASLPEAEKADMDKVVAAGSSQEIIDMLTKFKAATATNDGGGDGNDDAIDAAEGVRSTGLKLPAKPNDSQDYAAAWNDA